MTVFHITPGELDIQSLTVFGMSAKPSKDNPIGMFGTGLKMAIAILCRVGATVEIIRPDGSIHEFYTRKTEFRGNTFDNVMMRKKNSYLARWSYECMPFTTQLGKHWEVWQAFRELHANTLDENGLTTSASFNGMYDNNTVISVIHPQYQEAFDKMDEIFLNTEEEPWITVPRIFQVYRRPSKFLYYRGLRIKDLKEPSMFTYNLLREMPLTEDRTVKYDYEAQSTIALGLLRAENKEFIGKFVSAPSNNFEGRCKVDYVYESPGRAFNEVMAAKKVRPRGVNQSAISYYSSYNPPPPDPNVEPSLHVQLKEWLDKEDLVIPDKFRILLEDILVELEG